MEEFVNYFAKKTLLNREGGRTEAGDFSSDARGLVV
tara:strand:- start:7368 stop:7475 length:108 start_codon:yes stop_codon:yes gene_type:complete